ncbi:MULTISPECIES: hypothetical protein [Paenarthrobacter]|uniref:Uncharacterized protein n=1 Tax=Paenarthrobacter ureafaciens TaxID=37931 RepID=A0AAX3EJ94_PAEUR|nr:MULTISPECIES: hypothetical protein [Paenarthrobacter]BCW82646.1 hypothetical protein NicSoilE8_03190 [Arthrobacter sp. NicSoilE8]MDO5863024.1 hypothetical protein [Paenarthrobacter sp. SD-2]MDO5874089.1 hypothetical protein [Paenarthrobacter sp. SD-1]MEC3853791.1 hypothetical protein [Paenarthrobacter ureafaciens]UYV93525.1 hypothetical protein NL395_02125 [Paenarthrobacter ureafaciens]
MGYYRLHQWIRHRPAVFATDKQSNLYAHRKRTDHFDHGDEYNCRRVAECVA